MSAPQKQSNISSTPAPRPTRTNASAFMRSSRMFYFLSAILVFAVLTFLAHRQAPRPDPFQRVQALSWDWLKYPIERNAFKRLPVITSNLNDVFALPNSEKVWAVGEEGMIVHSKDGGETWVQQKVNWEAMRDSVLTQDLTEQEQIDPKQAFNANAPANFAQKKASSNVGQKNFDPPQPQTSTPAETTETKPSDDKPDLRSIYFVDEHHGWMVGTRGTILATKDGGKTWQRQTTGTKEWLTSVYFVGVDSGWVCGHNGILLSTQNGGRAWQVRKIVDSDYLESVFFINGKTGWVVGGGLKNETLLSTHDGGQNWQTQSSGEDHWFKSVYFISAQTGYAVAHNGAILATSDGGQSWKRQPTETDDSFESVFFINENVGWAVGDNGATYSTRDEGKTWREQKSGTTEDLTSAYFRDENTGWVVGEKGTILTTSDGGLSWSKQAIGGSSKFNSVHFVDQNRGWIAANDGTVLATADGGRIWRAQESGTTNTLESIYFHDAQLGWAVGDNGTILRTRNGGLAWQLQMNDSAATLNAVTFVDAQTGWAVGAPGVIIATHDGGQSWSSQAWGGNILFNAVCFIDKKTGWVVGNLPMNRSAGIILKTVDGGQNWFSQTVHSEINFLLSNVYFIDSNTGWAVGLVRILSTHDGGQTWQRQMAGATIWPFSVYFTDARKGWTAGIRGQIHTTGDGGQAWRSQDSKTEASLNSVRFIDSSIGWIVGEQRTILSTTDSGQTWKDPTLPYSRSFAPWYYLSLLIVILLLYPAFKKPKPIEAEQKTVADMLMSDKPISAGDHDPLEFNAIARGLSRFLRNENTQPPLTIAITGEWGSGKSSLMNLLKADLERRRFRPVWFNAWHHQKEEHLLAALLQNIRKQALPRWWRPEGMSFRARLFWRRVRRYRVLALLLLAGFSVAVGYFAADHPTRLHEAVQQIEHLFEGEAKIEHTILGWLQHKLAALGKTSVLALLSSLGAALLVLWRGLRAFGVNPANLMASLSSNFKLSEAKAQMGFRHDFAREFSEVTAALNPRTMLILIDDLDRCRPENVLEVLEAVNFLVSSGDCFVVMGLDLTRVERCVGLGFKDVAEELADEVKAESSKDGGKSRRAEFARQYLEKLINIEVPVPKPQPEQSQSLIVPQEPKESQSLTWWQNFLHMSAPKVRTVAPWLLASVVLAAGVWLGIEQFPKQNDTQSTTNIAQSTTTPTPSSNQPTPLTTTAQPARPEARADSSRGTGELIQPEKEPASFAFVYIALVIMVALAIWRLSIPSDLVVQDSPEFIDALKIWHPLLIAKRNTPRSVKRFVNRVRYFAMRQSAETETQSVWQRLAVWAGFKEKEEAKQVEAVPESILVALSAIHHFKSDLFKREHFRQTPDGEFPLLSKLDAISPEEAVAMRNAMDEHRKNFGGWPPSEDDYEKLQKLAAGIRIN